MIELQAPRHFRLLDRLAVGARSPNAAGLPGKRPGRGTGTSAEFVDYREYSPGDDVRYVDWNVYARLRRLLTKQYRADAELDVHLLLDSSASMAFGRSRKFDQAKWLVIALAYVGLNNLDRVGLAAFATRLHRIAAPQRGKRQLGRLRHAVERLVPGGETDFSGVMHDFVAGAARPGLALIVSDFFVPTGYQRGIERLLFDRFEVIAVQLVAAEELAPEVAPHSRLVDLEDPGLPPCRADARRLQCYRSAVRAWNHELAAFCARRGVGYAQISSSDGFETVVSRLLDAGVWRRR